MEYEYEGIEDKIYAAIENEDFVKYADQIIERRKNWGGETDIALVFDLVKNKLRVVELPPFVENPRLWRLYRDTKLDIESGNIASPEMLAGDIYQVITNNLVEGT